MASRDMKINTDWHAPILAAYIVIVLFFGGGAGWATMSQIESAAIAPGIVAAQSNKKTIQHFEGGIIKEILVRDGDYVEEGQPLIKLDDTQARASQETIRNQQIVARIQEARLIAERDKKSQIELPADLANRRSEPMIRRIVDDQSNNMRERAIYLSSQIDVLNAKIAQTDQEIRGLVSDTESYKQQLATIDQELSGLRQLLAKQLVPLSRVAALERERIRLQGLLDRSVSDRKKGLQSIEETKLTIIQLQNQFQQQLSVDIIEVRKNINDLNEKERVSQDVLSRVEIKSPRSGVVQSLKFFTIGAVVKPGDMIMEIAPTGDQLTIKLQISPGDIDSVSEGYKAEVRFPSYHSRRVPFMTGTLSALSFDRVVDPQNTQNSYFQGEVIVQAAQIPIEIKDKLKPGMPADVMITTGQQSAMDYFLGPLFDRIGHGLREK